MRINTNVSSITAQKNLWNTQQAQSRSMDKLSSGFRINRAGDDAAGLGIANQLRADNRSLQQAFRNAEQGNSVLQIAEGSTSTIQKMLERMKELATQAASDTVDDANGRARLGTEFSELRDEIDRIVGSTKFQGQELINGRFSAGNELTFQIGSDSSATSQLQISLGDLRAETLGLETTQAQVGTAAIATGGPDSPPDINGEGATTTGQFQIRLNGTDWQADTGSGFVNVSVTDDAFEVLGVSVNVAGLTPADGDTWTINTTAAVAGGDAVGLGTRADALIAMNAIDTALGNVNEEIGNIGAYQNRLDYTMANLKTTIQNNSAAESVIRDLDMAEEMTNFSKLGILSQAGQAMLAQANQSTQGVLQLLRG